MKPILTGLLLWAWSLFACADPTLSVENAWVREAPPSARMLAAYMTLRNTGAEEQVLIAVESPAFTHVMLHRSEVVDGVARMTHQDRVVIPAHGSVALEPGGLHLMMPASQARLTAGERIEFILKFADGSSIRAQADVRKKP
ncbi:copper chaperone PCu(A)C [Thiogranum longum]